VGSAESSVFVPSEWSTTPSSERSAASRAPPCRQLPAKSIIYGPDYTSEEHLRRLLFRGLRRKRSIRLGDFALGVEGLERFVCGEPIRRVHECVFGVLALESEPVDPRL
jgi:protein phosphatase